MSAPVQLNPHKSGDLWPGLPSVSIEVDGTPLDLTSATILIQFKRFATDSVAALALTNQGDTPSITVASPTSGTFTVPAKVITLPPSTYYFDVQVTKSGQPITYFAGRWQITPDVTR